jgi:hypothetical protein
MPTILRFNGLRIVIYPNDHTPAHVHVIGSDKEAKFALICQDCKAKLISNYGFNRTEINQIKGFISNNMKFLCEKWVEIHG